MKVTTQPHRGGLFIATAPPYLPGFVNAEQAVARELSKREVLKRMDSLRVDSLPVVDDAGFFVGTVERSQLTASLILEVVDRLEPKTAGRD